MFLSLEEIKGVFNADCKIDYHEIINKYIKNAILRKQFSVYIVDKIICKLNRTIKKKIIWELEEKGYECRFEREVLYISWVDKV